MVADSDVKLTSALIAASVAIAVFVLSKGWEVGRAIYITRTNKRRLIVALYTEIQLNLDEFKKTLENSPKIDQALVDIFDKDKDKIVHAPYARNMRFFDDLRPELHVLPADILDKVIRFYHVVESIYGLADGFGTDSFKNLTVGGKIAQIQKFEEIHREAVEKGKLARDALEEAFPEHLRVAC